MGLAGGLVGGAGGRGGELEVEGGGVADAGGGGGVWLVAPPSVSA